MQSNKADNMDPSEPPRVFSCGCAGLDSLFTPEGSSQPGLQQGNLLQLSGPPGTGKSRICMGFVLNTLFNMKDMEVLLIDLEGALIPQLLAYTADIYAHFNGATSRYESVLDRIVYRRFFDSAHFIGFLRILTGWLENRPKVKLVVIDSLSAALRTTQLDYKTRQRLYELINLTVAKITSRRLKVSVVTTSQMTSKTFESDGMTRSSFLDDTRQAFMVPIVALNPSTVDASMGTSSQSNVNNASLVLYYDKVGKRYSSLVSSSYQTVATVAPFTMDALGPCDIQEKETFSEPVSEP